MHVQILENIENEEIKNSCTHIDSVVLPSMNQNSEFNVTELRVPTKIDDSESKTSQILKSSKDF